MTRKKISSFWWVCKNIRTSHYQFPHQWRRSLRATPSYYIMDWWYYEGVYHHHKLFLLPENKLRFGLILFEMMSH